LDRTLISLSRPESQPDAEFFPWGGGVLHSIPRDARVDGPDCPLKLN